eukprot:364768-Chlamydomonas_euryale.AAC.3
MTSPPTRQPKARAPNSCRGRERMRWPPRRGISSLLRSAMGTQPSCFQAIGRWRRLLATRSSAAYPPEPVIILPPKACSTIPACGRVKHVACGVSKKVTS